MLRTLARKIGAFLRSADGHSSFEYGIVVALVIVALVIFIKNVGKSTSNAIMNDANQLGQGGGS